MQNDEVSHLHPLELSVLLSYTEGVNSIETAHEIVFTTNDLVSKLDMVVGQANQAVSWLLQKQFITEISKQQEVAYEVTTLGQKWNLEGTPAERLLKLAKQKPCTLSHASAQLNIDPKDLGTAFGILKKNGNVTLDEQKNIIVQQDTIPEEVATIKALLQRDGKIQERDINKKELEIINSVAKKRGATHTAFRRIEREQIHYAFTERGIAYALNARKQGLTGQELGALTPEMLVSKSWKGKTFRKYNINLPPGKVPVGRRNPYAQFLQDTKDKLVALGFEEFDGSLVQTEFWNSDALFMPQFHPARNIHDVYYLKKPQYVTRIEEPWLTQVADVHENGGNTGSRGWRYSFDKNFTKRLILRSQGTVLSAQQLPKSKNPGKYFGVLRVFRHDQVDATHLSDFYQTEGIIIGEDVNVKTLLGLLKIFATEFAHAEEVKYVPGYFPFTEPSIEVHIKHPQIGWMELGGSGIFRPEVTKPLGIDVPVAAWGIGVDRMATIQMGITDLRDLFTNDLDSVILRKGVKI